jgi:hypothetical protein
MREININPRQSHLINHHRPLHSHHVSFHSHLLLDCHSHGRLSATAYSPLSVNLPFHLTILKRHLLDPILCIRTRLNVNVTCCQGREQCPNLPIKP